MGKGILGTGAVVLLVILFTGLLLITSGGPNSACAAVAANAQAAATHEPVDGYAGDQLVSAASIMNAGAALGVNVQGQIIGVMTAMGESSLRNLEYGDAAGPDSRGLFQQRDTWGTLAERMNPTQAATFFFQRLLNVPNWETLSPSAAAHAVHINKDPDHYTKYFGGSQSVVSALTNADAAFAPTVKVLANDPASTVTGSATSQAPASKEVIAEFEPTGAPNEGGSIGISFDVTALNIGSEAATIWNVGLMKRSKGSSFMNARMREKDQDICGPSLPARIEPHGPLTWSFPDAATRGEVGTNEKIFGWLSRYRPLRKWPRKKASPEEIYRSSRGHTRS